MKNLPNFIIIGAAKCGTTSAHQYLNQSNDVFFCEPKEPKFLCGLENYSGEGPGDLDPKELPRSISEYKSLFKKGFEKNYPAIGEASVDYLYLRESTIKNIKKYYGAEYSSLKIVIFLRNPADRSYSSYNHLKRNYREILDFETSIGLEKERIANKRGILRRYIDASLYSKSVREYKKEFKNIKVIFFSDFVTDTQNCINGIRDFIGVKHKPILDLKVHNSSSQRKSKSLYKLISGNKATIPIVNAMKRIGLSKIIKLVGGYVLKQNISNKRPKKMSSKMRKFLSKKFIKDIEILEKILNKNLNHRKNTNLQQ